MVKWMIAEQEGLGAGVDTYVDPNILLCIVIFGDVGTAIDLLTFAGRSNLVGCTEGGSLAVLHVDEGGQWRRGLACG
jgi:hypothetical protein